ncbi:MAG: PAS domain-containing protein [Solirubrobacterales bacterium]
MGMEGAQQRPLELILARNLLTSLSTPSFLLDRTGALLFYNEAAGGLLGVAFEEAGRMSPSAWTATFGPFGEDGEPIPIEELAVFKALRDGRATHTQFRIRSVKGVEHEIEASALPIIGNERDSSGAMVIFWPIAAEAASPRTEAT